MEWKEVEKARCRACGLEIIFTSKESLLEHLKECPLAPVESLFEMLTGVKT